MTSLITTSQTIGPFPHEGWRWATTIATNPSGALPVIVIRGVLRDGDGNPISDGWVEAWLPQSAAADMRQKIPGFRRIPSDDAGVFSIEVPQSGPAVNGAPVLYATIFARGLVKHQFTAVFLEDDAGLAHSEILAQVPAERRATLIARKTGASEYTWDIWMQTDKETVFFDYV